MDAMTAGHIAAHEAMTMRRRGGESEHLDHIYAAPLDPFVSEEAFLKYRHLDLGRLSEFQLWQEQGQCRHRIQRDSRLPDWFRDRYVAIRAELDRRSS